MRLKELNFKPVQAIPNSFIGQWESQTTRAPFTCLLSAIPLKIQENKYVFTLTFNGNTAFQGKVGTFDEFESWFFTSALWQDIENWRNGVDEKGGIRV